MYSRAWQRVRCDEDWREAGQLGSDSIGNGFAPRAVCDILANFGIRYKAKRILSTAN
jgi:hypothetical protein